MPNKKLKITTPKTEKFPKAIIRQAYEEVSDAIDTYILEQADQIAVCFKRERFVELINGSKPTAKEAETYKAITEYLVDLIYDQRAVRSAWETTGTLSPKERLIVNKYLGAHTLG